MKLKEGVLMILVGIVLVLALEILTPINLISSVFGVNVALPHHPVGQINFSSGNANDHFNMSNKNINNVHTVTLKDMRYGFIADS